jgi:serine/threonine protein kinase
VLGQGFYGKVYLATNVNANTGEMVVVKQLDERKFQPEQFDVISADFSALHRIINRNIVSYKQIILDENLIYVVTEYVDNGTFELRG